MQQIGRSAHERKPPSRPNLDRVTELSDDVISFLSEGTRTAMLGYVAADGRPLVAPVWFLVDDGQLVERGTHRELLAASPLYARLAELQFKTAA